MTLYLINHDRRFAVEQAVFNYFPKRDGGSAVVRLSESGRLASAFIEYGGKQARGRAWVMEGESADNALRMAFYRAAKQITHPPPWGALTGVRPVKKAIELLDRGLIVREKLGRLYGVSEQRAVMAEDCAQAAVSLRSRLDKNDIALYISIPFCPTRCAYCSFVSRSVERDARLVERYIGCLLEEIKLAGEMISRSGLRVRAVYWGGGTPAVLSAERFETLAVAVRRRIPLEYCEEYTVEAGRPDAISPEKLAAYLAAGATRVAVNPQTLNREVLEAIGRRHTPERFFSAFKQARAAGFCSVNTDLIAGLPGDEAKGFLGGLGNIIMLAPENITVHTLAKKRASRVSSEKTAVCPAETVGEMLDGAGALLRKAGYRPYYLYRQKFTEGGFENTGWAKPGAECVYNLCMMEELTSVVSLGAGGVTKVVRGGRIERITHCKYPLDYIAEYDMICKNIAAFEAAIMDWRD
jgi:oxygen-independent coproporphyrinogen-3 oxidase